MHEELDYIVVGLISTEAATPGIERLELGLFAPDRERCGRFLRHEDRSRFVLGRALLAKLLREELEFEITELALTDKGRPYLPGHNGINFSITHAGDWVGVALALGAQVGIDIEWLDRRVDLGPLAERIFNAADLAHFRALPEAAKPRAFFRAWTGKEAVLKAKGLGLFGGVQEISVPLDDQPATLRDGETSWQVEPVVMPDGYLGSVAHNEARKPLRVRRIDAI